MDKIVSREFVSWSAALDRGKVRLDRPPVRWLMRNLIILGNPFHPAETQTPSLTAIMASVGIESDVEEDIEAGCRKLASGKYSMLTFSAARWRMLNASLPSPFPCRRGHLRGALRRAAC